MPLTTGLFLALALGAGSDRLLLCRPVLAGDPALARPEALMEAGRSLGKELLDYGVPCESPAEAARAAARAGLERAVSAVATGASDGSRYTLVLTSATEEELARRQLSVPTGADPVGPLGEALRAMRREAGVARPSWVKPTAVALVVGGAAALAAGLVLAVQARDQARKADAATTPEAWLAANGAWEKKRSQGAAALGVGGAALAGGAVVWFAF
jgi:hypothetical protein